MPPKKAKKAAREAEEEVTAPVVEEVPPSLKKHRSETITEESVLEGTVPFKRLTSDGDFDGKKMLKFISWNVAGLRALLNKSKDLEALIKKEEPDILCLQETKLSDWADCPKLGKVPGYDFYDSISVAKKGYSGTRTYVKQGISATVAFGFDLSNPTTHDNEGRVVTAILDGGKLAVVNSYVPNAGMQLERLDYRVEEYDPLVRKYLGQLGQAHEGVIWTGDLNVAERDYDRFFGGTFKQMQKCPGFTPEERVSFRKTLKETKMIDSFRHLYPNAHKAYSFWSIRFNQRAKGNGWRLDYFVASACLAKRIVDCFMLPQYQSSDHCPIVLWLKK